MNGKEKEKGGTVYVVEVFGIPVIRKYVEDITNKSTGKKRSDVNHSILKSVKIFMVISVFVSVILTTTTAVCIFYYPPPLFHELANTLLQGYPFRGAKSEELQKNLSICEIEKTTLMKDLGKCLAEKEKMMDKFDREKENFQRDLNEKTNKLQIADNNIHTLKENVANFKKNEKEFWMNEILLRQNLTLLNEKKFSAEQKLTAATETSQELKKSLENEQTRSVELHEDFLKYQSKSIECGKVKNRIEMELIKAEEKVGKMKTDADESVKKIKESQQNKHDLENSLATLNKDLLRVKTNLNNTEKFKNVISQKLNDVESQLRNSKKENVEHESRHSKLQQELQDANKELEKLPGLEKRIETLDNDMKNVIQEKTAIQLESDACRNKDMKHQINNAKLLEELDEKNKQLEKC